MTADFHYMSDNAGHNTSRAASSADSFVSGLNAVFTKQANVVWEKGTVDSPAIPADLGTEVRWWPTNPSNEWDDVIAFRTGGAPDVFFVWELEFTNAPVDTSADAATLDGNILFEDSISGNEDRNMAHEMGHYLGIDPRDYTDTSKSDELMFYRSDGGSKILHSQVDQVNP
ncbi:MAG: hypothetical protein EOM68_23775 [Spirochaetia bacterium]|nr:hypothetical protein [Spirochaetia bacterium]